MFYYRISFCRYFLNKFILKMPKYAVANGKKCGIYNSWSECEAQIKGIKGAKYKKFNTIFEAEEYMKQNSGGTASVNSPTKLQLYETITFDPGSIAAKMCSINALPVPKISPSNASLNDLNKRITVLESKFSLFTDNINLKFENVLKRISELDNRLLSLANSNRVEESNDVDSQNVETTRATKKIKRDVRDDEPGTSQSLEEDNETVKLPKCEIVDEIDGYSEGWMRHYYPDESGFLSTPQGAVRVYTDGACTNNGKSGAKAGIGVWFNHNHPLNLSEPVRGRPTNNNAEIQAANAAIVQASKSGIRRLHIFTDSKFVISCITSWIYKWKRNNWVVSDGGPVKNKVELIELDNSINNLMDSVSWTHVKGHSGDVGNTQADLLARNGAASYNSSQ